MLRVALLVTLIACTPPALPVFHPEINGSSLFVDLRPANRPALVGALDFELLATGSGKACAARGTGIAYWVGMSDVAAISQDPLTRQAIAAALADAISRLDDVDAILLTHIVTEAKGADRVCATITGRGIRFTKGTHVSGDSDHEPK